MHSYRHTQRGTQLVVAYVLVAGGIAAFQALYGASSPLIPGIAMLVLAVAACLFYSLTVSVSREQISLRFGVGLVRKNFRTSDVRNVDVVPNRWYYGGAVKRTPHGWQYSVSGLDAVELTLTDGRKYRVGTDEPKKLLAAIRAVIEPATQ